MGWNGADLITDFSAELGDTTTAFKAKVLGWINDGIREIATSHEWPFLREKAQVVLTASQDRQDITMGRPSAPSVATASGGSLADGSTYSFRVTYYESVADVESIEGAASANASPTGANLTVNLSSVPVSPNPLVTARKVYVSKDSGAYYYHGTIADNTTTTYSVSSDTSSTITPPKEQPIFKFDGDLYISGTRVLKKYAIQRLIDDVNGVWSTGTPLVWALVNDNDIIVYPKPSSAETVSFYYFKLPRQVFDLSTSVPQIPAWMYHDLYNYVMWRGYAYRDRAGKESKQINFFDGLRLTISRKGKLVKGAGRVRSTTPDSDGRYS